MLLLSGALCAGCVVGQEGAGEDTNADSSKLATILDFEFDGEVVIHWYDDPVAAIKTQFLYTVGQLNGDYTVDGVDGEKVVWGDTAVGQLNRLDLSNIQQDVTGEGDIRVTYHARLPVAWGSKWNLPTTYTFKLPKYMSQDGLGQFALRYLGPCTKQDKDPIWPEEMYWFYRPNMPGCELDDADVSTSTATVSVSRANTTANTYPEYHKVWEDGVLKVVVIFSKDKSWATWDDPGISDYEDFVRRAREALQPYSLETEPADLPDQSIPWDVTLRAQWTDGKQIEIVTLLVEEVASAPPSFGERYNSLTPDADLIVYNGHSGLGENVRALASKGQFVSGQYLMLFINSCDSYTWADGTMVATRAPLNPDDPTGTKYLDTIVNVMPAYFGTSFDSTMAIIYALLDDHHPSTYEEIFDGIDPRQVVMVMGDEDNVYDPG